MLRRATIFVPGTLPASASLLAALAGVAGPPAQQTNRDILARARLFFGENIHVDAAGRLDVADHGGNAVRIFDSTGKLALAISIAADTRGIFESTRPDKAPACGPWFLGAVKLREEASA